MQDTSTVRTVGHAMVRAALSTMRERTSSALEFRASARVIARSLAYEATADLPLMETTIETPICSTRGALLAEPVVAAPILRAGLSMLDPFLDIVPGASVGFLGLRRDETTLAPTEYYRNLPSLDGAHFFLLDPMLATGGSVLASLASIDLENVATASLLCFIAAPEGVAAVHEVYPDVRIFTASVDERLNERGYIVPGLGDAGDRLCGTL